MNPALSNYEETTGRRKSRTKPRLKLTKQERLRRSREFKETYSRGRRLSGPHLTIFFKPNQLNFNRLGLSVSKKGFKSSVQRHYIQRRLRQAYRLNKMCFSPGYDIIISGQRLNRDKICFEDIKKELLCLAQKARLLKSNAEQG